MHKITKASFAPFDAETQKTHSRQLNHLNKSLTSLQEEITTLALDTDDPYLIQQYDDRLSEYRVELRKVREKLLFIESTDSDELLTMCTQLDKIVFDCGLKLKRLLKSWDAIPTKSESNSVKLPKLDVPRFDGNVLNWSSFWEQFTIGRTSLTQKSPTQTSESHLPSPRLVYPSMFCCWSVLRPPYSSRSVTPLPTVSCRSHSRCKPNI